MRLAYLANRSALGRRGFIADEIAALESAGGASVKRFAVHVSHERRHDRGDENVIDVIRSRHVIRLLLTTLSTLWDRPAMFLAAVRLTVRIARQADRRPWAKFMRLAEACVLLRETRSHRIDHVHVHGGTEAATVALLCRALGGPPFSFAPHGPVEFERPHAIALEDKIREAAFVVADGAFARSQLLRWCGHGHWEQIHVVRPVLDVPRALPPQFKSQTSHLPSFLCVGRLCEAKGQRLLIEAAALLAAERLPFEILICGDGPLRSELEALARLRGLSGRVRFLGAPRQHDLQERMSAARAVVVPSLSEGLPHPVMGAFALARPVIACNVAGVGELVEGGKTGWLVEPGSVTALADALREAIGASPDRIAQLGAAGRGHLVRHHNPAIETPKLHELFHQSVAAARGRRVRPTARPSHVTQTSPPRVSVVIVNWNRGGDVAFNLRHLAKLDYPNLEILIVDNGSTDGSPERFANLPGVHLIKLPHNHGPSRARNVGIQAATGKYVVFLDSDAVLAKRALHALVARMESDPSIGIAGCKILNWHTRKIDQWIYAEPYETHGNTSFDSYSFSAAGAIARAEALRDVGGFWERLFIYNEEVDLSIRMLRGGYRIVFAPDARVFHRPAIEGRAGSGNYFRLQIRNWIWIYFRYYPRVVCWWKVTTYSAIYLVKGLANRELVPAIRGIFEGLRQMSIIREFADDKLSYEQVGLIDSLNRRTAIRLRR